MTERKEDFNETEYFQKVDNNKYTFDLVNSWINNADTKVSVSCGISSVVFAVILSWVENYLKDMTVLETSNVSLLLASKILFLIAIVSFLFSLWFHFWALNPSLTSLKKKQKEEPVYSIFFEDIKRFKSTEAFITCVDEASIKDFNEEVLKEIYINSDICSKKMRRFRRGMWLSVTAIAFAVISGMIYVVAI